MNPFYIEELKRWLTAFQASRALAQHSTTRNAGGLNYRVRNGTGCDPAAMAVIPKTVSATAYLTLTVEWSNDDVNKHAQQPSEQHGDGVVAVLIDQTSSL